MKDVGRKTVSRNGATIAASAILALVTSGRAQTLPGTLSYSWIGNSFMNHTTKAWVPDEVRDLCVASDGTVFTAGYSEAGGSGLAIKNGAFFGRYSGFNSGFGDPVKAVATDETNVYWGGGNGVQRYGFASSTAPNRTVLAGSSITGLAYKGGELYISDYNKNLIRVFATSSMTQSRQWNCPRPGKVAVDNSNRVWVIQYAAGSDPNTILTGTQVLSFSSNGVAGPSITDVTNPLAITVNGSNQLLVGGLDPASQIRIYGKLGGTPSFEGTFGTNEGIFSGTPGLHAPLKFHQIRGLGVDGAGNIYVCMMYGAKSWGQSVEAYTPKGALLWEVHGFDYVECAAIDPDSETDVYDHQHHFTLDYTKSDGKEWTFKGFTVNRFKYANDPRVTFDGGFRAGVVAFRVSGRLFIAESDQGGYPLNLYRFNSAVDGEVAIPSVSFSGGNPDRISRDANGNGQFDAGETANGAPGYYQYHYITPNGGICRIGNAAGPATITYYPCQGLDSAGNPIYTAATSKTWNKPPEFSCIRKVVYDTTNNIMYVGGQAVGTVEDAVVRLCRYNNWTGARTKAWDVTIPYEDQSYTPDTGYGAGRAYSVRQTGQFVFIQYGYGYIRVHDKDTGVYLGTIKPSLHGFNGGGGQVDITHGMTAYKRTNGEYVILTEDAGHNHIVMTRWCPSGDCPLPQTKPVSFEEVGFVPLFAEEASRQWRQCGPGRFALTNEVATGVGGMGLWWYAGAQFTNFVLRGEFMQEQAIADSGVFLRFPDPGNDPWNAVHQGHEMEIGDPNPKDPTWRTGSIYPFQASTNANTKPVGQWNQYEITCIGQNYSVRMNGKLIMTWTDPKASTSVGYIGLQNYDDGKTVRHRNVRIKRLP